MKKFIIILAIFICSVFILCGSSSATNTNSSTSEIIAPDIEWQFSQNGTGSYINQCSDGGYVFQKGNTLVKTDVNGVKQWNKSIFTGDNTFDSGLVISSVKRTADNNFIAVGYSSSYNTKIALIKLDSQGKVSLNKIFNFYYDTTTIKAYTVSQTTDGGYLIGCVKNPTNNPYYPSSDDLCILKTNSNGDLLSTNVIARNGADTCRQVEQTLDGGYLILADGTNSSGYMVPYVLKLDNYWNKVWEKTVSAYDASFYQTNDGYLITSTKYIDYSPTVLNVKKMDNLGNVIWDKSYAETGYNIMARGINPVSDGFIISALKLNGNDNYFYVVKIDENGISKWNKSISGSPGIYSIKQTNDKGYIIIGNKLIKLKREGTDLFITSFTGDTSGFKGGNVLVNDTVENQGNIKSSGFYIDYYLSEDPTITSSDINIGRRYVSYPQELLPRASSNRITQLTIPSDLFTGYYYIGCIADSTEAVQEINENNNMASYQILINSPPLTVNSSKTGGTYNTAQNVMLSMNRPGNIYFTIDNTTPSISSTKYTSPINIIANTTLKFFAVDSEDVASQIFTETYTIDTINPLAYDNVKSGLYNADQTIVLSMDEEGTIYYTLDGSDPSETSNIYNTPLIIENNTVLKFFGIDTAGNPSATRTETYVIDKINPIVNANVKGGLFNSIQYITLIMNEEGTIYFTINGENPTNNSTVYNETIVIPKTSTLKFFAVDEAGNPSTVYTETYTIDNINPAAYANVKSGLYNTNKVVSLSMSEIGNIYYTINGATPTKSSTKYTGPLTIASTANLKFIAFDNAGNPSPVYTAIYTIDKTAPKLISTYPKRYATGVSRTSTMYIKFSEKLKASVNWSKIVVKNKYGKAVSISKWISNNVLYIKTSSKRSSYSYYTIYIPASAIKDYAGNNFAGGYTIKFKTGR